MENAVLQAISKSLDSLARIVKDLDARLNSLEDQVVKSTSKPASGAREDGKRPIVVRHSRYADELFREMNARGGVTYVFELDYKKRIAKVGIAVCSLKENFNKATGRKLAEDRLKTDPIVFEYSAPSYVGLVDAFWDAVTLDSASMSKDNRRIINSIKTGYLIY